MAESKSGKGIFIVGWDQFLHACDLSLNAASALLIMARGSGRDNVTTSWSCNAIAEYAGITRKRATDAVQLLIDGKLIEQVKGGSKPQYKLSLPDSEDGYIFLPNSIIDGVGEEVPPVKRLRQMLDVKLLKLFIQLYALHDLDNEGGLPADIVSMNDFRVNQVYTNDIMSVYGFLDVGFVYRWSWYVRSPLCTNGAEDFNDFNEGMRELRQLGLIEACGCVLEGDDEEAEVVGSTVGYSALEDLFKQISRASGRQLKINESSHFAVVPKHIKAPEFRATIRLTYRPHTVKTARWHALEQERDEFLWSLIDKAERLETARAIEKEEDF